MRNTCIYIGTYFDRAMALNISLKLFEDASDDELRQLLPIARKSEIMKQIGLGETWDAIYVTHLALWSRSDRALAQRKYWHWLIIARTGALSYVVGYIGLRPLDDRGLQIRYFVDIPWQRKGVATRAIQELIAFARAKIPQIDRIFARVARDNVASTRTILRAGFRAIENEIYYLPIARTPF